jgi:hypothetical protein
MRFDPKLHNDDVLTGSRDLKINNNISTAAVFLDIERALDTTWRPGLLYKLYKLKFSTNLIKLISSFLSERKFSLCPRRSAHA